MFIWLNQYLKATFCYDNARIISYIYIFTVVGESPHFSTNYSHLTRVGNTYLSNLTSRHSYAVDHRSRRHERRPPVST